ncbi:hypothetical protein [Microbacterium cremeum]|uniref:hypothetical protein n=1 Tax=Microbacterium cremeum TaxID=2782169 RepID=UPI0018896511|nr:hypothetical protein [Microbacterium cremeum]
MVVEGRLEDAVAGVDRVERHPPGDREREERGRSRGDARGDDRGDLVAREHVQQRRCRHERRAGQIRALQESELTDPGAHRDGRPVVVVGGSARRMFEECVVPVVQHPRLRAGKQRCAPPHHRTGAGAQVVHDEGWPQHPSCLRGERART